MFILPRFEIDIRRLAKRGLVMVLAAGGRWDTLHQPAYNRSIRPLFQRDSHDSQYHPTLADSFPDTGFHHQFDDNLRIIPPT